MAILKLKNKTTGEWEEIQAIKGNGISSIEKTATVGNKDTYTIYFTNGSTTTYEVANGEVTREELEEEVERLSMIYNAFPTTTGEVEEPSINGTAEVPFKEIGLKGNTTQNGTPTPDTPVPVNVVTGDNTIDIVGKNLLPQDKYIATTTKNGITYTNNGDGTFNLTGTATANTTIQITPTEEIKLKANQPYYLYSSVPYDLKNFNMSIAMIDNGTTKFLLANNTYTPTATPTNVRLQFYIGNGQSVNQTNIKLMLVKGKGASYPINLGDIELCKIGDYQDSIVKDNGKWYLNKQIGKVVLDGTNKSFSAQMTTSGTGKYRYRIDNTGCINSASGSTLVQSYCNRLIAKTSNNTYSRQQGIAYNNNNNQLIAFIDTIKTYTLEQANSWLEDNNLIIDYILATPTVTEITDTTLIEQLDNLEKAYSYDTQTNISQTNQDKPFIISYEAILSLRNVLNNLETRIAD